MRTGVILGSSLLLLATTGRAQPPAAGESVQAAFEAASQSLSAGDWAMAASRFAALEPKLSGAPRSLAVVRLREGQALLMLPGRRDEALPLLHAGLDALPTGDASLADDRAAGFEAAARGEEAELDYPAARRDYQALATAGVNDRDRLTAAVGLARVDMFDDGAAALAAIDRAAAIQAALHATATDVARLRELRGRVLLNGGRFPEASTEFKAALAAFGGLTERVDRDDIDIRSDLAIAAMLQKDEEEARKYLAYTGAGFVAGRETMPAGKQLPPCGAGGLQPEDVGIVEFSIADDGHAVGVRPIYASRGGPAALAFAQAVTDWSWTPDEVKAIKPFFRIGTRLEMRCTTASEGQGADVLLRPAYEAWIDGIPGAAWDAGNSALPLAGPRLDAARAELARRERANGPSSPTLIPLLFAIAESPQVADDETHRLRARAVRIASASGAPVAARAHLALTARTDLAGGDLPGGHRSWEREAPAALLGDPAVLADPRSAADVRLARADGLIDAHDPKQARSALEAIAADKALDPRDPIRAAALLRLASLEQRAGDLPAARAAFEQSGLTARECPLVDLKPAMRSDPFSANSFPREALRWGFNGWATLEFDVDAAGRVTGARTVLAYPPFVFGPSTVETFRGARYTQTYRPDGALGCGGEQVSVVFQTPG